MEDVGEIMSGVTHMGDKSFCSRALTASGIMPDECLDSGL